MGFITENRISYIIIMRNLYFIKQNNIFKFSRITYYSSLSYDSVATDKGTVANLCIRTNNCRAINIRCWRNHSRFCYPHMFFYFFILIFGKKHSYFHNEVMNLWKNFPRIGFPLEKLSCDGLGHIQHVCDGKIF